MILNSTLALALRNVRRQGPRSIATLAAIAAGVAGLILAGGFVQDIFIQLGEAIIHSQTGHIQITAKGFTEGKNRNPEAYLIKNAHEIQEKISASSPRVTQTTARLSFSGTLNNGKRDLGIVGEGIQPDAERTLGSHMRFSSGRALSETDHDAMIVGMGVANSLGLRIGDRVTLVIALPSGALNTQDFELVGIFESFSKEFDARAVRIPLATAQKLADTSACHMIVVTLDKTDATTSTVKSIKEKLLGEGLEVVPWHLLSDFYEKTVQLYDRQFGVLRLITLLMVLLSVANSVNMSLFERTREFGTMKALGNTSTTIFRLVLTESFCLGAIGAALGIILGCILALCISAVGISMPPPPNSTLPYTALIRLDSTSVCSAGAIGCIACILASLVPARRASQLDITEALRHGI